MQIGGCRRERHGAGADTRRYAAHDPVQVHAALRHGGGGAARACARARRATTRARAAAHAPGEARARQLRTTPVDEPAIHSD